MGILQCDKRGSAFYRIWLHLSAFLSRHFLGFDSDVIKLCSSKKKLCSSLMIVCQFRTFSYVGNDSGFEENGAELKYLVAIRWFVFMLLTQNKYLLIIV